MTTLVAYHTRTGNTKKVAKTIAKNLNAEIDEIIDEKSRKGILGWLSGGRDAWKKQLTSIKHKEQPEDYDLVIIGTPIWAATMTPAIRTYLATHRFTNVAFFCTYGGQPGKAFTEMRAETKKPKATLALKQNDLENEQAIEAFCEQLKRRR